MNPNSKVRFGIDIRRALTGADLYVKTMQAATLLVLPYVFLATSYWVVLQNRNLWSVLFDIGISILPRWEALGLSFIYRMSSSEVIFFFVMMAFALIFGIVAGKVLHDVHDKAVKARKVFMVLIIIDLVRRLIPMRFNAPFGIVPAIIGFAVRVVCLGLIYKDLKADEGAKN